MSTLQVNSINSFTPSDPVTINDSFKVTGSSTFTGSIDIQAPHTITGTTASFNLVKVNGGETLLHSSGGISVFGDISGSGTGSFIGLGVNTSNARVAPGTISGSGFNIASKVTANSGSFIGGVIVGIANDNAPLAGGVAVGASGISSSGDILGGTVQCKNGFENIGAASSQTIDGFNGSEVTSNSTKVQLRLTLNSSIADGAKAGPLKVKSNKISVDSAVMASIVGPVSGGALSNSISASILSTFVENNTCSIYLYNETGQTLEDNTTFTCSLMVIQ